MKEAKFTRTKNRIENLETGEVKIFDSINLAKKESWRLQGSALGSGVLRRG